MTTKVLKFIKPYYIRLNFSDLAYQLFLLFLALVVLFAGTTVISSRGFSFGEFPKKVAYFTDTQLASVAALVNSPFYYTFKIDGTLSETGKMDDSSSPYWWLNSGGLFYLKDGMGKTIQNELPTLNKWRLAYSLSNPLDTDNGYHPQNIFRMVLRSQWRDFQQEAYFKINNLNLSASPNRNASNGLLLFNRYQDAFNLYYTGLRVDGYAVIKKKINGVYYTLAYKSFYNAAAPYNRDTNPNLLPKNTWIGLRSEVKTNPDNTVSVKFFIDKDKTGNWILIAEATDDGKSYGGAAILQEGYAGIRTDFMDVEFDDYRITGVF
ncbi:MAG: hypothetical protein AAB952_00875 [Patescibacteria group bacterium]